MSDPLIDDLRQQIASGQAIAIVGAGVSMGATNNAPAASWGGLLRLGIDRCVGINRADEGWAKRQREALSEGSLQGTLEAATAVSVRLGFANGDREWTRWLEDTVGALSLVDVAALKALAGLGIRIATTNYDGLIEQTTGLTPVTWKNPDRVLAVLRGERQGIIHLHGFWDEPNSVVLGVDSYERVLGQDLAQALQQGMARFGTLLFIGCGEGLNDPNFSALRAVLAKHPTRHRHFRLEKNDRCEEVRKDHEKDGVSVIGYGPTHGHLATFLLEWLKPEGPGEPETDSKYAYPDTVPLPPEPARCIGRKDEIEALVSALLNSHATPVLGSARIGKSTVCLQALHDKRVATKFGHRRYFVRCDTASTAADMIAQIGAQIRLPPGPNIIERVARHLDEAPVAIALDNLETPWEREPLETEEALRHLSSIDTVALVASIRGFSRPLGVNWSDPVSVVRLSSEDSRALFLAIAGDRYENDPRLSNVLTALDGVPLAIELMAHAAEVEYDLVAIWQQWQTERTQMLRRGRGDQKLLSLGVSLELSMASPRMTDAGRRLLSLLGLLPDGIAHEDLNLFLPACGVGAATTLRQLAMAFDERGRLKTLAPIREHLSLEHRPASEDAERVVSHYIRLTLDLGPKCGMEGGDEAIRRLSAEAANIEGVLMGRLSSCVS